jgi:hypothetical protein
MVATIDQRDARIDATQSVHGFEAAKPRADNDDAMIRHGLRLHSPTQAMTDAATSKPVALIALFC